MYKVIGESIKSATSIKLGEIFGNVKRYKETVTNIQYPNFFIYQVSANINPDTKNRWQIDYLMNIRYRYVKDVATVTNLEETLDNIGLQLMAQFTDITLNRIVKVKNARYEKADGVLQFFFNVTIRIMRELTEGQKMQLLELNRKLKKEDK